MIADIDIFHFYIFSSDSKRRGCVGRNSWAAMWRNPWRCSWWRLSNPLVQRWSIQANVQVWNIVGNKCPEMHPKTCYYRVLSSIPWWYDKTFLQPTLFEKFILKSMICYEGLWVLLRLFNKSLPTTLP